MVVAYVTLGSIAQAILMLMGPAVFDLLAFCLSMIPESPVSDDDVDGKGT